MEIVLLFTISDILSFRQKLDVNVYAGDRLDFHYIMLPLSIKKYSSTNKQNPFRWK